VIRKDPLEGCTGFDWDEGNVDKNWHRHGVAFWEAEDVFFNEPLLVRSDGLHGSTEARYLALGQTNSGRLLFVSFTVRGALLRVISARDMTRREVVAYGRSKA
jgi:uncharacterized DUF497 family protein